MTAAVGVLQERARLGAAVAQRHAQRGQGCTGAISTADTRAQALDAAAVFAGQFAAHPKAAAEIAFKLMEAAPHRCDAWTAHELVALVCAGATFTDGKLQERDDKDDDEHDAKSPEEHAA